MNKLEEVFVIGEVFDSFIQTTMTFLLVGGFTIGFFAIENKLDVLEANAMVIFGTSAFSLFAYFVFNIKRNIRLGKMYYSACLKDEYKVVKNKVTR